MANDLSVALERIKDCKENRYKELNLSSCGLTSIPQEIWDLYWLEEIDISNNDFSNTSPFIEFSFLGNVTTINARNCHLKDLEEIRRFKDFGFAKLKNLYLNDNNISDLSPLSELTIIESLGIANNNVYDLSPLANFRNIKLIALHQNPLSDIHILKNFKETLDTLTLGNNNIQDFSPISDLTNLTHLRMINCSFDVSILKNLIQLRSLELNNNSIIDLDFLQNFTELQSLNIENNAITTIPNFSNLTKLESIVLINLKIQDISPLSNLSNLEILFLQNNKIKDIVPLSNLINLKFIDLSHNQIQDITPLSNLAQIYYLKLNNNQIENINPLIKPISNSNSYEPIELKNNKIQDYKQFEAFPKESQIKINISNEPFKGIRYVVDKSFVFDLSGNPIKTSQLLNIEQPTELYVSDDFLAKIPPEIMPSDNNFKPLQPYFESIERNEADQRLETKIILVGNSTAGKSSLLRVLKKETAPKDMDSTHGVEEHSWDVPIKSLNFIKTDANNSKSKLYVNILDFGGQEYYHGTHDLFMDPKAVYVLLWEQKTNSNSPIMTSITLKGQKENIEIEHFHYSYWLDNVRNHAPIETDNLFLVQNKIDLPDTNIEFLEKSYRDHYDIDHEFHLSVFNAQSKKATEKKYFYRFELFKEALLEVLYDKATQKPVSLPKTWLKIRHDIRELLKPQANLDENKFAPSVIDGDYIERDKFQQACQSIDPKMSDAEYILLREYLDKTSVIYFKPGMNKVFIKSSWITEGVYEILNDKVLKQGGVFSRNDIMETNIEWDLLLNLMETENIIFSKEEERSVINTYIAPQYFDKNPPNEDLFKIAITGLLPYSFTLKMPIFHYKRVLRKIITHYYRDKPEWVKTFWRDGLLFITPEKIRVLISGSYQKDDAEGQILVCVEQEGKYVEKQKEIFNLIHTEFKNTVKNNLHHDIKIALNNNPFIPLKDLKEYAETGISLFRIEGKSFRLKDFELFLDRTIPKPLRVFVSYAHTDIELKNRLLKHLAPLKNLNRIEVWTDEAIRAGERWEDAILGNLRKADIILLLISSDFNASRYIWEKELKEAIERDEKGEAKVIPIALRPCNWRGMPYERNQAIPEFGKKLKAVTAWDNEDAAFAEVSIQLERVINEFKT